MNTPRRTLLPLFRPFLRPLMMFVIAVVVWSFAMPARAQESGFEVAVWVFPPFAYVDDDGRIQGRAVEAVRETLFAMGYTPNLVVMPFKRCLASMREGAMPMMLPCATSKERREYMAFSDPVYHITTVLWKKGGDRSKCWQDFSDLAGLRIGVGQGYSYGTKWDEAVATDAFSLDYARGASAELTHFRMAADDRIDMFISDLNVGLFIKERHAPAFDNITPCPKRIGENRPFGVPVSRKYFEDRGMSADAFLSRFNTALEAVLAEKDDPAQ